MLNSRADWCKNNYITAVCDEELKFGTVIEEVMKSKTGFRAKYSRRSFTLFFYSLATNIKIVYFVDYLCTR